MPQSTHEGPPVEVIDPSHTYFAFVFEQAEASPQAITTLLEQVRELGYPMRYWWLAETEEAGEYDPDWLVVGINYPGGNKLAGIDLFMEIQQGISSADAGVGFKVSNPNEYSQVGKTIEKPESIYWPDGLPLFPEPSVESVHIAIFALMVQDIQAVAQEKLGRGLADEEVEAVLKEMRNASDWNFYLGGCILACRDYGRIEPGAPGHRGYSH